MSALTVVRPRKWAWQLLLTYVGGSLLCLVLLGRLDALGSLPTEFEPLRRFVGHDGGFFVGLLLAALAVGSLLPTAILLLMRRPARARHAPGAGSGLWLSISAGISEELFFRLFVPLLLCGLLESAALAFGIAALLFGLTHAYQGWAGIVASGVLGLVMSALYVGTGQLWVPMAVHALIDVNSLVVRPTVLGLAEAPAPAR